MKLNSYLDNTYLKTSAQAQITKQQTEQNVLDCIQESIDHEFKLVMIRPEFVQMARTYISNANSSVLVGSVIGFHEGTTSTDEKLKEAKKVLLDGADELDFVINYRAFLKGDITHVEKEVLECTQLVLNHHKAIKWIIEIAALTNEQIIAITELIRDVVLTNFGIEKAPFVFVKSSTGFFETKDNKPNGATFEGMQLLVEHATPLPVKAAGGVKTTNDAVKMINLGVSRIGTSSGLAIVQNKQSKNNY